jgi:hypothetical protein
MNTTTNLFLTKSLFKTAFECPAKLRYAKDPQYGNNKQDNEFLMSLAEGGFQVGEMAKVLVDGGVEVKQSLHAQAVTETNALLTQPTATIYEAALTHGDYFIRVDILKKAESIVDLIEVKSKSFDPTDEYFFKNRSGNFGGGSFEYLLDIAFQTYVAKLALPDCQIRSFLMLPNKSKAATINGLNQLFPIVSIDSKHRRIVCEPLPGLTKDKLGEPLLELIDVTEYVNEMLQIVHDIPGMAGNVGTLAKQLAEVLHNPWAFAAPIQSHCKSCEFRVAPDAKKKSGFKDCWKEVVDMTLLDANEPLVVDVWDGRKTKDWINKSTYLMRDLTAEDLNLNIVDDMLSRTQRQWMQVSGEDLNDRGFYFDAQLVQKEMNAWKWPINLIDFETSRTALPFHKGVKPYGLVAFQWSHHVLHQDGKLEHLGEYLGTDPGEAPNVAFLTTLKETLSKNDGSVMMWSPYENSVLNTLADELDLAIENSQDLLNFIETLTKRKQGHNTIHLGERVMIDLCVLSSQAFFHEQAGGSNSIKKVLPAMLKASGFLKQLYSQPIYGGGQPNSINFTEPMVWWQLGDSGNVIDPYKLLPPVFADLNLTGSSSDDSTVSQGGAAMTAYGRLQFEHTNEDVRQAWRVALLKYCELDTLAMAMIVQGWQHWVKEAQKG